MTLPPTVPCALVAWDPTMAEASASAVSRSRTARSAAISSCVTSAPRRSRPFVVARPRSSSTRWMATMLSGADSCPAERRRPGRCRPRPGGRRPPARTAPRRGSAPRRAWRSTAVLGCPGPDPLGRHQEALSPGPRPPWRSRSRSPRLGTVGGSPTPWCRSGRRSRPVSRSTRRRSSARRRRSRACSRGGAGCAGAPARRAGRPRGAPVRSPSRCRRTPGRSRRDD